VNGSPLALAYYTNLLSGVLLLPLVWLTGESEAAMDILKSGGDEFVVGVWWGVGGRFIAGALLTVSLVSGSVLKVGPGELTDGLWKHRVCLGS
jgi:hypothetical protein